MTEFEKEIKIDNIKQCMTDMNRYAKEAVDWLENETDAEQSINSFLKWNGGQERFWYYYFQLVRRIKEDK